MVITEAAPIQTAADMKYAATIIPIDLFLTVFQWKSNGFRAGEFLYLPNPYSFSQRRTRSREIEVKSRLKCQSEYHQMEDLAVKSGAKRSFYQSEQFNPVQGN